ncbi:MAG: endo alpha-1,4 polygalactosaminidase [Anaerolineales bacterium]|nr:endo alpha-1,4 polygalactosaminidase [Anaerolineales bacterium]
MQFRTVLIFLFSSFLIGCAPASDSPALAPVSTETLTLMPSDSQPATSNMQPETAWWHPAPGLTWQWQLTGKLDLDLQTDVIDIDLDVGKSVVDHYHSKGTKVICYISVGSYENWRTDADQFPDEVLGKDYEGWSGEKWLDIRRIDLLAPIILARLDECAAKGFDGVEPDNMQIWDNDTGFPLTYEDQLRYALWLADEAHKRGLAIGQKNAPDQTKDLVEIYDFAITEDAFYYDWAKDMLPYIQAGKPVFAAEYTDLPGDFQEFCRQSKGLGFSTILKHRDLDAWLETCP